MPSSLGRTAMAVGLCTSATLSSLAFTSAGSPAGAVVVDALPPSVVGEIGSEVGVVAPEAAGWPPALAPLPALPPPHAPASRARADAMATVAAERDRALMPPAEPGPLARPRWRDRRGA